MLKRLFRTPSRYGTIGIVLIVLLTWTSPASAKTGVALLSGLGYGSDSDNPKILLGAELSSHSRQGSIFTGIQESMLAFHVSDVISIGGVQEHSLTTGVETEISRSQGPFRFSLGANLFFRQIGEQWVKSSGFGGSGSTGRLRGDFRFDYIEGAEATFPWFQKDLNGVAPQDGDHAFYRAHLGVSAAIIPRYNISWSQDVRWRRDANSEKGTVVLTTGPELVVGEGRLAAQAGLLFGEEGIKPTGLIRYDYRPIGSKLDFQVTIASDSLERLGPVVYGWLGYDGDSMGYAVALRLEQADDASMNPAIYFSIQPKF